MAALRTLLRWRRRLGSAPSAPSARRLWAGGGAGPAGPRRWRRELGWAAGAALAGYAGYQLSERRREPSRQPAAAEAGGARALLPIPVAAAAKETVGVCAPRPARPAASLRAAAGAHPEAAQDPVVLPAGGRARMEGRRPSPSPAEPAEGWRPGCPGLEVTRPGAGPLSAGEGEGRRAAGSLGAVGIAGAWGLRLRCEASALCVSHCSLSLVLLVFFYYNVERNRCWRHKTYVFCSSRLEQLHF